MSDCHWCKEADKEIAALKLQIDEANGRYDRAFSEAQRLERLLRVSEDALGPDRTPTDRRAALMQIGKALIVKRTNECTCGWLPHLYDCPADPRNKQKCDKQYAATEDTYGYCGRKFGHEGSCGRN